MAELKTELKADIDKLKSDIEQFRSEMHHAYEDVIERIADSETKLLKAFYSFAENVNIPPAA